ncbi:cysteinyl-tRNA synthetase [Mortierella sp. GBA30]|nr:cysteinyl-tRNA synthetase [Mortierella sp. GBA30]
MAPLQTISTVDRKTSADSFSSSYPSARSMQQLAAVIPEAGSSSSSVSGYERRLSVGSRSYVPGNRQYGYGQSSVPSSLSSHPASLDEQQQQQQRPRNNSQNGRSHHFHPFDALAQTPLMVPGSNAVGESSTHTNSKRKNNARDGGDSGVLRSFFRSSSRPPSPTPFGDASDSTHSPSGPRTRKTSFSSHKTVNAMNQSYTSTAGSFAHTPPSSGVGMVYGSYSSSRSHGRSGSTYGSSSTSNLNTGASASNLNTSTSASTLYQHRPAPHPFSPDSGRRKSTESYSRTPSPSQQQRQNAHSARDLSPTTPPLQDQPQQRTGANRGTTGSPHRRTKSSDFGDTYSKRPRLPGEPAYLPTTIASPAKESKETKEGKEGKEGREGKEAKEAKKTIFSIFKKKAQNPLSSSLNYSSSEFDLGDLPGLTGSKNYPRSGPWPPLSTTGSGAETWLAPESWGVQPSSLPSGGLLQKSLALTPEDVTSDEMEQSDYESWDYGKKRLSTIRIFRPDTTYTTVNCVYSITTSELSALLGRKIFKPDTSKYHLYILRNNVDFVQNCNALREVRMAYNDLERMPSNVRFIVNLQLLDVTGNRIRDLDKARLDEARKLDTLILQCNRLDSIPEPFAAFQFLRVINLSSNNFAKFPLVLCQVTTLEDLDLSFNDITEIPNEICQLSQLRRLLLYGNRITPFLPMAMESLLHLRKLDIRQNGILNMDPLNNLPALEELLVDYNTNVVLSNSFGALVRASIVKCNIPEMNLQGTGETLTFLDASSNKLTSLAPGLFDHLRNLETLKLDNNSISSIPSTIGALKRLRTLSIANNNVSSIPDEIAELDCLIELDVHGNSLGELPAAIWNCALQYLNASSNLLDHNFIAEIPRGKVPNPSNLLELYLSGNQLTNLPADDIESLRNLRVLHVSGNKLTTLPAELGKINRLQVLDVGCNMLKYNISNWPYDWNWNWNLELKYLNMSGNKRLQIKRQTVESVPVTSRPGNLSEFGNLTCLRILGLMDVTITDNVPDDTVERRVRTSSSTLHNMSYGMADTLGRGENLCIWDLVHPKFQTKEDEVLFGLFDGRSGQSHASCKMTSHLKDRFGAFFKIELERLEGSDTVVSALRRTFLGLDRELWPFAQGEEGKGGASALVAYIKGVTLYSANVGDTIAVLVKKSDSFQVISQKHIPWNPTEAARIKRSGGFVGEEGLLNDELDLSRSFGQYHLVPIVNSNPYIETTTLTEEDDFIIMASKSFWDFMSYTTAVDIAKAGIRIYGDLMYASQKLRDIAISYGAHEHMVVMLIGVGDLFKKKEPLDTPEYHQHKKRPKPTEGPIDALKYLKPEIEPPQGDVAMVFTGVQNSTKLWEDIPVAMGIAIKEHFNIMRRQLRSIGGYEVKNEGVAMMASFSSVPAAVLWCFKVQELLVYADWPQDILESADGKIIYNAADPTQPLYRGLSVRMGIHWGQPVSHKDEVTRRMDYYGSMVNRAARICASADGGEICVSSDVMHVMQQQFQLEDLQNLDDQFDSPHVEHLRELKKMGFEVVDIGEKKLKGLETPESLHLVYTRMLAGRFAMDPSKGISGTPMLGTQEMVKPMVLDPVSVRSLQTICLRLERLVSGAVARHGRASEQSISLLSLAIKDTEDQDDLVNIAENCVSRIENCFSQLYMAKSGQFVEVLASLGRTLGDDPTYLLRALQMYVNIVGGLDSPLL